MAASLPNIPIPKNTWIDLYNASGITVGTAIRVQNIGVNDVYLTVSATEPGLDLTAYNVLNRENGVQLRNTTGDPGAWAYSNSGSLVSVAEV